MVDWREPHNVAACARCGSGRVHPKLLVMGPIAGIDSDSRSYICEVCRYEGLPVIFDTEEERARFEREKKGLEEPAANKPRQDPWTIPILPLLRRPLVGASPLAPLPLEDAWVVGVGYDGRSFIPSVYRVVLREYWDAVGGPRYNASRILVLDLAGINEANPGFDSLRHLVKRCDVWLDLGARDSGDVMDGYMLDVERVVAGTKTLPSLDAFVELYALSAEVMPCLDWNGHVVWGDPREGRVELREVIRFLRDVGFPSLCVMDLRRLGTERGPDPALLEACEGLDVELYVGGGLQETDVPALGERGFAGGLVDPYTPIIRSLLGPPRAEGPAEASAPEPASRATPSPRAVPDAG